MWLSPSLFPYYCFILLCYVICWLGILYFSLFHTHIMQLFVMFSVFDTHDHILFLLTEPNIIWHQSVVFNAQVLVSPSVYILAWWIISYITVTMGLYLICICNVKMSAPSSLVVFKQDNPWKALGKCGLSGNSHTQNFVGSEWLSTMSSNW